jgi:hypothetical protein
VNTWGAIRHDYKNFLVFVKGSSKRGVFIQKDYFSQILIPYIESILEDFGAYTYTLGLELLFIEDGNSTHGYKSIHNYCA